MTTERSPEEQEPTPAEEPAEEPAPQDDEAGQESDESDK
jgi:hypothetical protein